MILLWVATVIDWFVAQWMARTDDKKKRKKILLISLIANLGMLGYFKYGNFLLANFVSLVKLLGIDYQPPESSILLPIGISFYTFVTLSYTIDIYRKEIEPAKSFLDYSLLITFFPHLVAGPILRAAQFLPQCLEERKATLQQLGWGFSLIVLGLFDKVVLADGIVAPVSDAVYWMKGNVSWTQGWIGSFAFTAQLFLDFNGYSLCAIGSALCLGFVFPDNFRFPYAAIGFSDFWTRMHISLSSWLRDYLYISLGGNRKGTFRTFCNLMITMLLGGLWHGATWHHVIFGGISGGLLVIEIILVRYFGAIDFLKTKLAQFGLMLLTFFVFSVSLVMFRAPGVGNALRMYGSMFSFADSDKILFSNPQGIAIIVVILWLLTSHWLLRNSSLEETFSKMPWWLHSLILSLLIIVIILTPGENRTFIYFQF
ncbi:MAG: MBOAT family protein [Pyrinomonadaceae bacterium]|nr:MBOAT family protein [Pyrinomonadaceae bacterium]